MSKIVLAGVPALLGAAFYSLAYRARRREKPTKFKKKTAARGGLYSGVAAVALVATCGSVLAGGFAIREQSASSQGASFAGNAAGYDLREPLSRTVLMRRAGDVARFWMHSRLNCKSYDLI